MTPVNQGPQAGAARKQVQPVDTRQQCAAVLL
jgi:hypothetical protein